MDRLAVVILLAFVTGCGTNRSLSLLSEGEIHQAMTSAETVATEPGFDSLSDWLTRPHETRMELGQWLPGETPTLLVTLDIKSTSHAEGLVHHILAVFDPVTHQRLTPAFHYVADHAEHRRIMPGPDRQCLVYVGRAQNGPWRKDVSFVVIFAPDRIEARRVLGDRDPEQFAISMSESDKVTVGQLDGPHFTPVKQLTWAVQRKEFE